MGRSDHDSVASVVGDQRHPAEDERAQEDLAQLGIGLHHLPQRVRRHLQELAVLAHPAANQGPAPGQNGRLSGELARSVEDRDRLLPAVDQVNDLHLAGDDDVEIARDVALVEQDGPARDAPALTALAQPLDLLGRQPRKHLRAALPKVVCHGSPASARTNYGDRWQQCEKGWGEPPIRTLPWRPRAVCGFDAAAGWLLYGRVIYRRLSSARARLGSVRAPIQEKNAREFFILVYRHPKPQRDQGWRPSWEFE